MPQQQQDELRGIVSRMVDAGESEEAIAAVIRRYHEKGDMQAKPETSPGWLKAIPGVAATGAGMLSGRSLPSAALAGGAGALGEGARGFLEFLYSPNKDTAEALSQLPARMMTQGAKQAGAELAGDAVGGGARLTARGMYRAAALPINKFMKYGDLVKEGLTNRVPVSRSGVIKAAQLADAAKAKKATALADADQRVTFRAGQIADDADKMLVGKADELLDAGEVDPRQIGALGAQPARFRARHPQGIIPTKLEATKKTMDSRLGEAYEKQRKQNPLTPREESRMAMDHAASRALEDVVPNYREMNRDVMNKEGLRRMIDRRVNPGSGGNQGLENALTMLGGIQAIPARLAMLPPVLSRVGIGLNEAAKVAPFGTSGALRALLALMDPEPQEK